MNLVLVLVLVLVLDLCVLMRFRGAMREVVRDILTRRNCF
jgi:hypothetical protein